MAKFQDEAIITRIEGRKDFIDDTGNEKSVARVMTVDSDGNLMYSYVWDKTLNFISKHIKIGDKIRATYLVGAEEHREMEGQYWIRLTMIHAQRL